MSRKKGKVIEKATLGQTFIDIRMDSDGVFSCDFGDGFSSPILKDVREWTRTKLREASEREWFPVMEVHMGDGDMRVNNLRNCTDMSLYLERCYIAWDSTKWIYCPWVVNPAGVHMCFGPNPTDDTQRDMPRDMLMSQRMANSREFVYAKTNPIKWPIKYGDEDRDKNYFVPYTEDNWNTMIGILARFKELRASIHAMLGTDRGWVQLQAISSAKLLQEPK